jgi:glycogen synthase
MVGTRGAFAFVQHGPFSGVNRRLAPALAVALRMRVTVVDVANRSRLGRGSILNGPPRNLVEVIRERGMGAAAHPHKALSERRSTAFMFESRSREAQTALAARDLRFVIQTQTMFDASMSDLPFFIFTDHTARANRHYSSGYGATRWSARWIELEGRTYRRADHIFTTSDFARRSLIEDYGCLESKVTTVGSAPLASFDGRGAIKVVEDGKSNDDRDTKTILFVGVDWERKGGPLLVKAFRELRRSGVNVRLRIVGCRPRIRCAGVEIIGPVGVEVVAAELQSADIFCLPSWAEPSAVAYLEAAQAGVPVVATRVGATPERVLHGRTGYLCDAGDCDELVEQLRCLLEDAETARRMSSAARTFATRFNWEVIAQNIAAGISTACAY